uniref:deoxyribonuclease II n=1 Tax=Oreochromis niloticus TaxID=8128 RepID=I3JKL8_ORENI
TILFFQDVLWMIVLTVGLFILYKKPAGFDYVYIDSTDQKLKKNNKPVNHQAGVLANTLKPYFERTSDSAFIAYNDQPPGCNAEKKYGHSKGVVMMDTTNVVWLLHSTPNFPEGDESNNFFPPSGKTYAQIFMCVTLPSTKSANIGKAVFLIKQPSWFQFLVLCSGKVCSYHAFAKAYRFLSGLLAQSVLRVGPFL